MWVALGRAEAAFSSSRPPWSARGALAVERGLLDIFSLRPSVRGDPSCYLLVSDLETEKGQTKHIVTGELTHILFISQFRKACPRMVVRVFATGVGSQGPEASFSYDPKNQGPP